MKKFLSILLAGLLSLSLVGSVSANKPEPFTWKWDSGGFSTPNHPTCLGEDSYGTWYGRGYLNGSQELDLHFCDDTDFYPGTNVSVNSPGGAALIVRTADLNGGVQVPITVYTPYGVVYTANTICFHTVNTFVDVGEPPLALNPTPPGVIDATQPSWQTMPGGDYRIVISGVTRNVYGYIQVGMSYTDWINSNCIDLVL